MAPFRRSDVVSRTPYVVTNCNNTKCTQSCVSKLCNRLKAQTATSAHVRLRFNREYGAQWLFADGIRVKPPAMMKCAINSYKHASDTAVHQIGQLLAVFCVCVGGGGGNNCYIATALAVSPWLVFDARAVHVVFVVDKVALSQVLSPSTCGFPYQLLFQQCHTLIYPSSGRWTMGPLEEAVALRPRCRRTPRECGTTLNKYIQCNREARSYQGVLNLLRWSVH